MNKVIKCVDCGIRQSNSEFPDTTRRCKSCKQKRREAPWEAIRKLIAMSADIMLRPDGNDVVVSGLNIVREFYGIGASEDAGARELIAPAKKAKVKSNRKPLPVRLRYSILERDGFLCTVCGRAAGDGVKLHVDHIVPVAQGGRDTPDNLRTLCADCNLGKSDRMPIFTTGSNQS